MRRRQKPTETELPETLAARYWRAASAARAFDLERIAVLGILVQGISALVHALQKERGASSIFLGSEGAQFKDRLAELVAASAGCEHRVRQDLAALGERLDPASCGARCCGRIAFAVAALDALRGKREQIGTLAVAPQDAIKTFNELIASLLCVGFEVADIAADPELSRVVIALVNFAQGKEYAGQERAVAGAALSRGTLDGTHRSLLRTLALAQTRCFKTFVDFAAPAHLAAWLEFEAGAVTREFAAARRSVSEGDGSATADSSDDLTADLWYAITTRRIDAMRDIEESMAATLGALSAAKLDDAHAAPAASAALQSPDFPPGAPLVMLVTQLEPDLDGRVDGTSAPWFGVSGGVPAPVHSILAVVEAQSRQINAISSQLESARSALAERTAVEKAKAILMRSRRLSESDAYTLLRQTAMRQNKRIPEIANAVISMAGMFPK